MKNFCVIDIGTNAVKVKIFSDGKYYTLKNKHIHFENGHVSKADIIKYVEEFIKEAKEKYAVERNHVYMYATEGIRSAPNGEEIKQELEAKTQRKLHVLDPKKEARLSILGGLSSIRLKGRPKQILFLESGGGSTEVSLLDMTKRPFGIIASKSISIGSRIGKEKIENQPELKNFLLTLRQKHIKIDPSLKIVVNATGALKLLAHKLQQETFRPDLICKNQNEISVAQFCQNAKEILDKQDYDEQFLQQYFLKSETLDGFIGHINILHHILSHLNLDDKTPITTTLGGLKDGAAKELEQRLKIGDNTKDDAEEKQTTQAQEKNKDYAVSLRRYYQNLAAKENAHYEEDTNATCYKASLSKTNGEKINIISSAKNNVDLSAQNAKGESKIPDYEDFKNLVLYAKQQGQIISFGNIKSDEFKARLWLACLENGVDTAQKPQINKEQVSKETLAKLNRAKHRNKDNNANDAPQIDIMQYQQHQQQRA